MVEGVAVLVGARDVDGRMATPARHLPPDVEAPRWPPAGIDRLHDERERKSRPDGALLTVPHHDDGRQTGGGVGWLRTTRYQKQRDNEDSAHWRSDLP